MPTVGTPRNRNRVLHPCDTLVAPRLEFDMLEEPDLAEADSDDDFM